MNSPYHDRMFFDARKRLAVATRVDTMHCLSAVRRLAAELLTSFCAEPSLVRLVRSDIVESLLAREALRIAALGPYLAVNRMGDRERLLEVTLAGFLFDWLLARVDDPSQRVLINRSTQQLAAQFSGARLP